MSSQSPFAAALSSWSKTRRRYGTSLEGDFSYKYTSAAVSIPAGKVSLHQGEMEALRRAFIIKTGLLATPSYETDLRHFLRFEYKPQVSFIRSMLTRQGFAKLSATSALVRNLKSSLYRTGRLPRRPVMATASLPAHPILIYDLQPSPGRYVCVSAP